MNDAAEPERLTVYQMSKDHQRLDLVASFPVITETIKQMLPRINQAR